MAEFSEADVQGAVVELARYYFGNGWHPTKGWDVLRGFLKAPNPDSMHIHKVVKPEELAEKLIGMTDEEWDSLVEQVIEDQLKQIWPDVVD